MFPSRGWIFAGLFYSCFAFGRAGPPLITDDPSTPGPDKWEINLALSAETNSSHQAFEVPLADFNYGVGENLQLKYEVPWPITRNPMERTHSGMDRSEAGIKWRF